jgi:hypothetical protein
VLTEVAAAFNPVRSVSPGQRELFPPVPRFGLMRQRFEVRDVLSGSRSRYRFGDQDLIALRGRLFVRTGDAASPLTSSGFAVASTSPLP